MTFESDMREMQAADICTAITSRLTNGTGQPWNDSQGEPLWALLVAGFKYWRTDSAKLNAIDSHLAELVPRLFSNQQWHAAAAAFNFVASLASSNKPWQPSQAKNWPFERWVADPCLNADKTTVAIAAMTLQSLLQPQTLPQLRVNFDEACELTKGEPKHWHALWLLEAWKSMLMSADAHDSIPWFELYAAFTRFQSDETMKPLITAVIGWVKVCGTVQTDASMAAQAYRALTELNDWKGQAHLTKTVESLFAKYPMAKRFRAAESFSPTEIANRDRRRSDKFHRSAPISDGGATPTQRLRNSNPNSAYQERLSLA